MWENRYKYEVGGENYVAEGTTQTQYGNIRALPD
jgi:hypothetical protein